MVFTLTLPLSGLFQLLFSVGDGFPFRFKRLEPLAAVLLPRGDPTPVDILADSRRARRVVDSPFSRSLVPLPLAKFLQLFVTPAFCTFERRSNSAFRETEVFRMLFAVANDSHVPAGGLPGNVG